MNLSQDELQQVNRIKSKIPGILIHDRNLKNFGATSHKYIWKNPVKEEVIQKFEEENSIELPRSYRIFLSEISNGGPFHSYGLYPLEKTQIYGDIKKDSRYYPEMTQEEFEFLQKEFEEENSDDNPNYDGLLVIGTQGCTYDFCIVVTGKHRGRILLTDQSLFAPFYFVKDDDFLDFYERWLDSMISGMNMTSFPVSYPGNEDELIKRFNDCEDDEEKFYIFISILRFPNPSEECIKLCKYICRGEYSKDIRERALIRLFKFENETCHEFLDEYLDGGEFEKSIAIKVISAIGNKEGQIEKYIPRLVGLMKEVSGYDDKDQSMNSFKRICIILSDNNKSSMNMFIPFFTDEDEEIKVAAIWSAGKSVNARFFVKEFIAGLKDDSPRVVLATIQALQMIGGRHLELMPYLKEVWERYPDEKDHIHPNLGKLLESWGFKKQR